MHRRGQLTFSVPEHKAFESRTAFESLLQTVCGEAGPARSESQMLEGPELAVLCDRREQGRVQEVGRNVERDEGRCTVAEQLQVRCDCLGLETV